MIYHPHTNLDNMMISQLSKQSMTMSSTPPLQTLMPKTSFLPCDDEYTNYYSDESSNTSSHNSFPLLFADDISDHTGSLIRSLRIQPFDMLSYMILGVKAFISVPHFKHIEHVWNIWFPFQCAPIILSLVRWD
jgi:hypothetical protein